MVTVSECVLHICRTMITCTNDGSLVYWPEGTTKVSIIIKLACVNDCVGRLK